jgi:hypothetical protein
LGTQVAFGGARALSINLTPSPARCAPLLELAF